MKSTFPSLHHFNGSLRFLTVLWPLNQLTSIWKLSLEWTCSWTLDLYQFIALDDLLELEVDQTSPSLQLDPGQCSFFCMGSIYCHLPVSISNEVFKNCLLSYCPFSQEVWYFELLLLSVALSWSFVLDDCVVFVFELLLEACHDGGLDHTTSSYLLHSDM
jgi:hypothetical protein